MESQNQLIEQQKESLRAKETEIMKLQNALKDAQRHAGHIVGTSNIRQQQVPQITTNKNT